MLLSSPYRQTFWRPEDIADTMRRAMTDYRRSVGQRLEDLRTSRSLSQEDAAYKTGVSLTTWRNWARGKSAPYERNWKKIQAGFELEDEQIAALRGAPPSPLAMGLEEQSQLDRIEAKLDNLAERLDSLTLRPDVSPSEMRDELQRLLDELDEADRQAEQGNPKRQAGKGRRGAAGGAGAA